MRIGIDGAALTIPYPCGTKVYATSLLQAMAELDHQNEYIIFSSSGADIPLQKNFRLVVVPQWPICKRQVFLPLLMSWQKLDLIHFLEPYSTVWLQTPKIVTTVHDLDLDDTYPWLSRYWPNRLLAELTRFMVIRHSRVLIVISRNIKGELEAKLGVNKNIVLINQGVDRKVFRPNSAKNLENYFLTMGDFARRKNLHRVLRAYAHLSDMERRNYRLKIVVSAPNILPRLKKEIERLGIIDRVDFCVKVNQLELVKLYQQATTFLYLSLYEGFGLPILEAMACGCAVITSNRGATMEVGGRAAVFVNPESVRAISQAMSQIINNPSQRFGLVEAGIERASYFSWLETAKRTIAVYQSVYEKN